MTNKRAVAKDRKKDHIPKNTLLAAAEKIHYEFFLLGIMLLFFLPNRSDIAASDVYAYLHILDYRIGFAPRLFIGSLMSLFAEYKSVAFMDDFLDVFSIVMILVLSFAAGRIIRRVEKSQRAVPIFFILLFLAVPYARTALYADGPIISLDRFLILFTTLSMMAADKKAIRWIVPALLGIAMATYHGFAFTYFPAVAPVLLYALIVDKKTATPFVAVCVAVMAGFSGYFFLYPGIRTFPDAPALLAYASERTDLLKYATGFDPLQILDAFLFGGSDDFFIKYRVAAAGWGLQDFKSEAIALAYLSPLFAIWIKIWTDAIKMSSERKRKALFILCLLSPLVRLPMFVFSSNHIRPRASVVIVQLFLILYFLYRENPEVTQAAEKVVDFFKKYKALFVVMALYFSFVIKIL